MLIDIGVNLSNPRFKDNIEQVLLDAQAAQVNRLVLTGTSVAETQAVIDLCDKYQTRFPKMLFATAGVHPHEASTFDHLTNSALRELSQHPSIVAIGETGLDFNRMFSSKTSQERALENQIELAIDCQKPLFLHERDASQRQLDILKTYRNDLPRAVIHCFTGSKKALFSYLDLDLYIGITGWICDERRGSDLQKIVDNIPLNRLMVETDAPYLIPRNMPDMPKNKLNQPAYLPYVIDGIANHRDETKDMIATATTATAEYFFNLKK
ncbi:MAG: TatD family hydrolase [Porticoccaceae bacterium]|nr:TatD family hydrolase [Porticoccaceae bacterium]